MVVYFADRKMNILGQASTLLPGGLGVSEDVKTEEIETGINTFSCKIGYTMDTQKKSAGMHRSR